MTKLKEKQPTSYQNKQRKEAPPPEWFSVIAHSLVVLGKERIPTKPMIFNTGKKFLRLDFLDEEAQRVWAFPMSSVTKIMYCMVDSRFLLFAVKIPPLPGKMSKIPQSQYEIMFITRGEKKETLQTSKNIHHFFMNSCPSAELKPVTPVTFYESVGDVYEDVVLYALFADEASPEAKETKPIIEHKEHIKMPPLSITIHSDHEDVEVENVVVQFKNGQRKMVLHQYLVKSLEPKGWLCNSLIDIMLEYFLQERLSEFPEWYNDVVFYDTLFFQKLAKYSALLKTVSIDNYSKIMQEIYPAKAGRYRGVPVFKKELLVIPVIIKKHWMLVLVHKPMNAILNYQTEYNLDHRIRKQRCQILILDSKTAEVASREILDIIHQEVFDCIKSWIYLMLFAIEEYPNVRRGCVKIVCDKLPKQPNDDDCGVFLLLFLEEFVLNDWSWTDLRYEEIAENIRVEKIKEFFERSINYRSFISDVVKELAINLPPNAL